MSQGPAPGAGGSGKPGPLGQGWWRTDAAGSALTGVGPRLAGRSAPYSEPSALGREPPPAGLLLHGHCADMLNLGQISAAMLGPAPFPSPQPPWPAGLRSVQLNSPARSFLDFLRREESFL